MAGSLNLSRIEQAGMLRHLEIQYGLLCKQQTAHPDCGVLHEVLTRLGHNNVIGLSLLEILIVLRHLRCQHRRLDDDMLALEERRLRGGHDGRLDAAHRALDTEAVLVSDVLRKLWDLLSP